MSDSKPGNDLPKMVPDRDQIRSRQTTAGPSSTPRNTASPARKEPSAPRGGSGVPGLMWVLVLVLFAISAGLGLMVYSLQQSLAMFDERLQLADDRIVSVQRSMTETDESVVMNETAINNQFRAIKAETDMQMSEIRKLWAVSNERNRGWIETNQQNIAQLQSSVQSQIEARQQAVASLTSRLDEQAETVSALRADLNQTSEAFTELQASLENLNPASLEERLLSLTLTQENLLVEQGTVTMNQQLLEEEVAELNDVLRSIDAGRLEANRRMVAVSERVDALEERLSASVGVQ